MAKAAAAPNPVEVSINATAERVAAAVRARALDGQVMANVLHAATEALLTEEVSKRARVILARDA